MLHVISCATISFMLL